ncbi:MAG TPA: S-layer homology domain-containing protein [Chloroflexia bacterium]|nr:S-layer homology domain-containing protein [Chloroflexia bacterium]
MRLFVRSAFYTFGVVAMLLLAMVLGIGRVSGAPAADGDLDPTFGSGGKVTTSFPGGADIARAVTLQADNKIVTAGSAGVHTGVARYMSHGDLDSTFGSGGKVVIGFDGVGDAANAIALQPDGKIITAGYVYTYTDEYTQVSHFALARLNSDGTLDSTFGTGGKVTTAFGLYSDQARAVVVQSDGKIIAAGEASPLKFALARYMPDGTLDSTFGTGGQVTTQLERWSSIYALALQSDGKIVAGGYSTEIDGSEGEYNFALARYLTDGSLDPDFGSGGSVATDFGSGAQVRALAIQPGGEIVAAGFAGDISSGTRDFALASYNEDGSLDTDFGDSGKVTTDFGNMDPSSDTATSVVIQPNGKIVVAGDALSYFDNGSRYRFALARYSVNGELDSTFGGSGKVTTVLGDGSGQLYSLALQGDGRLVAVGYKSPINYWSISAAWDAVVIRYKSDGALDQAFGTEGVVTTDYAAGSDVIADIAIQSDGKIVTAGSSHTGGGDFALARYLPDGTLDPAFGSGGRVSTDFAPGYDQARALLLLPDGKILAVGTTRAPTCDYSYFPFCPSSFALVRYGPDGSLDESFGEGGKVTTEMGYGGATGVALQADDKIVVVGTRVNGVCVHHCTANIALARYNPDGSLDDTFGDGGLVYTFYGNSPNSDSGDAVRVQPDGKILVAGHATVSIPGVAGDFALLRYHPDGTLDESFGNGGKVNTDFEADIDAAYDLVLLPDGKIVLAGKASHRVCLPQYCRAFTYFGLARYMSDGTLDEEFGDAGKVMTDFPDFSGIMAITLQPDGKFVAAGYFGAPNLPSGFAIARYMADGSLDPDFGTAGKLTTKFGSLGSANAVAIQSDGNIVVGGQGDSIVGGLDFALARYESILRPPPHAGQFQDVDPSHAFYSYIECMGAQGIISGYACGGPGEPCGEGNKPYFRPGSSVTRGQVAKMISSAAGISDPIAQDQQTFEDVIPDSPFWLWIERLAGREYIGGYTCGGAGEPCVAPLNRPYFRPGNNLTRGQLAKIDSNAAGITGTPSNQMFEDIPSTHPFYDYIGRLAEQGAIGGYACGSDGEPCVPPANRPYFRASADITRGQTAKIATNTFFPDCQRR